jgi:hypothetical protein
MQHRLLTEALLRGFGTAQELATAAGVHLDTAKRYRRGETYPDALTVARLMRHSRLVVDAMLRMAGLDDLSLEQEQARLLRELLDLQQRRAPHVAAAMAAAEIRVDGTQTAPASPRGRAIAAAPTGRPRRGALLK